METAVTEKTINVHVTGLPSYYKSSFRNTSVHPQQQNKFISKGSAQGAVYWLLPSVYTVKTVQMCSITYTRQCVLPAVSCF